MLPKILRPDGKQQLVKPKNEKRFTKTEVKSYVSGPFKVIKLDSIIMVIDANAHKKGLPKNVIASKYVGAYIAGDVFLCNKGEYRDR